MLSKEQANTAADSLLQGRKQQSRWSFLKPATSAHVGKWAPIGMVAGMGVGIITNTFLTGQSMPGMGFGMFAGALLGAYFDKQLRPRFLALIIGLLGLGGSLLWYLTRGFA